MRIIIDIERPESCKECPCHCMITDMMTGENLFYCRRDYKLHKPFDDSCLLKEDHTLENLQKSLDDIEESAESFRRYGKLHERGIRENGEALSCGLEMASSVVRNYCLGGSRNG